MLYDKHTLLTSNLYTTGLSGQKPIGQKPTGVGRKPCSALETEKVFQGSAVTQTVLSGLTVYPLVANFLQCVPLSWRYPIILVSIGRCHSIHCSQVHDIVL